jgi:hypothetical protein
MVETTVRSIIFTNFFFRVFEFYYIKFIQAESLIDYIAVMKHEFQ